MSEEPASPGWHERLVHLSPRALLSCLQGEKALMKTLFTGFRPGADALRHPLVLSRLEKELERNTALAEKVGALPTLAPREAPVRPPETPAAPPDDPHVKAKLKALRARVLELERLLAESEAAASGARGERDRLQAEARAHTEALERLTARLEQERRQHERSERQARTRAEAPREKVRAVPTSVPAPPLISTALDDALGRLLFRGKYAMVAGLCRELLTEDGLETSLRATVHSAYASALVGLGQDAEAAEHARSASDAYLDTGQHARAAEALALCVGHRPALRFRSGERSTLQRLLVLSGRSGESEAVLLTLRRTRIAAPTGYAFLCQAVQALGAKFSPTVTFLTAAPSHGSLGPTEPVALPSARAAAATVTASSLAFAVESGDEALVGEARQGISALRQSNPALAEALLEAVAALAPHAVFPFLQARLTPAVVDASNVARYVADPLARVVQKKTKHALAPLLTLQSALLRRGYFPVLLIADATLRHHIDDPAAYQRLVAQQVIREAPAGTEADELLLLEARSREAVLVSRDRFHDWGEAARDIKRLTFDIHATGVALIPD